MLGASEGMTIVELYLGNRWRAVVLLLVGLAGVVALMATTHAGFSAGHVTRVSAEGPPPKLFP